MSRDRIKRFFFELKRRKVMRVVLAYAIVGWLLIEIASVVFPVLLLPEWTVRLVIALVALGFLPALVLSWVFDLTPRGIERTDDEGPPEQAKVLPSIEAPAVPPQIEDAVASVAVLPFDDLSGGGDSTG